MHTGIVKWYNDAKGFGFAIDDQTKELVLINRENISNDPKVVFEYEHVSYDTCQGPKGSVAIDVKTTKRKDMDFYNYEFTLLDDERIHLSKYVGKVMLIVNTASHCGLTPQYAALEKLYNIYKDKNFVILAFPSGNFAKQEFETNEEIKNFCESRFDTSFPIFMKSDVVPYDSTGPGQLITGKKNDVNPLYQLLAEKTNIRPQWNFHKYLVSKNGEEILSFNYDVNPMSDQITNKISEMLNR